MGYKQSKYITLEWNDIEIEVKLNRQWIWVIYVPIYDDKNYNPIIKWDEFRTFMENNMCCQCRNNGFETSYYVIDDDNKRIEVEVSGGSGFVSKSIFGGLTYGNTHRVQTYHIRTFKQCSHLLQLNNQNLES